ILLLLITKFMGASVNGADRWLSVGGFSFQPSEFAKLSLITFTAFMLSKLRDDKKDQSLKWILIATSVTCGIILIDNFSTAMILFGVIFLMMFIGQIPFKKLGKLILALIIAGILFVSFLVFVPESTMENVFPRGTTWKERIKDFHHKDVSYDSPDYNIEDNYQVSHAKMAIARGGIFGVMPGNSQERDFLPQAYSDFIYAIIIEELGLVGGLVVLFLYVILFIRAGIIAARCEKLFPKYLVLGSALLIVTQALANMMVAVNLMPVTGQPLPLISRGGTSTIITCAYIGIILSVSRFETPKGIQREEQILSEAELEVQRMKAAETEDVFTTENINAGEF
ncbi:MAG: FtsW/RodA/SpoVE family cell cycle protein, partial [Candidatus Azobacteroides sp.]|nr:FtsW/RodA/SpoVE family cell cycle protein [Candidatus Azobacteroides sp.]